MTYRWIVNKSNTECATIDVYPSRAPETKTPFFIEVRVTQSLVFCVLSTTVCFPFLSFFVSLSLDHYIVCPLHFQIALNKNITRTLYSSISIHNIFLSIM